VETVYGKLFSGRVERQVMPDETGPTADAGPEIMALMSRFGGFLSGGAVTSVLSSARINEDFELSLLSKRRDSSSK
jgi:hypothetical protein